MYEGFMANGFAAGGQLTTTTDGLSQSLQLNPLLNMFYSGKLSRIPGRYHGRQTDGQI